MTTSPKGLTHQQAHALSTFFIEVVKMMPDRALPADKKRQVMGNHTMLSLAIAANGAGWREFLERLKGWMDSEEINSKLPPPE